MNGAGDTAAAVPDPFDVEPPLPRPEHHPLRRPRHPFDPGAEALA